MKTIPLIILSVLMAGCEKQNTDSSLPASIIQTAPQSQLRIYQTTIDGCQYLSSYNVGIIHKANCTNHLSKP